MLLHWAIQFHRSSPTWLRNTKPFFPPFQFTRVSIISTKTKSTIPNRALRRQADHKNQPQKTMDIHANSWHEATSSPMAEGPIQREASPPRHIVWRSTNIIRSNRTKHNNLVRSNRTKSNRIVRSNRTKTTKTTTNKITLEKHLSRAKLIVV